MNKEKLKELLDNTELVSMFHDFLKADGLKFEDYIKSKRKELEEPTYKTEDGFEVKDGDFIFIPFDKRISEQKFNPNAKTFKMYKLKENAEKYLIEHAEVLSYKDIQEYHDYYYANYQNIKSTDDFLKQKIREKLKL